MAETTLQTLFSSIGAGFGITVLMTLVSFVCGALIALPVALMRTARHRVLRVPAILFIDISRGIPPLVWLLIIYFGFSSILALDPLPAALIGLTIISAGYLAENFRAGFDNVKIGQKEAAAALGLTPMNQFWRIVAPQAVNLAVPPSASYAVALLKDTALASIIGVTDIVFLAQQEIAIGTSAVIAFSVAAILYLMVGVPLAVFSRFIDGIIRSKVAAV